MVRPRQPLVGRIKERCTIDQAGCWTWSGRVIDGQPEAKIDGSRRCVRPAVYLAAFSGLADIPTPPPRISMACGNRLCVNPHHMVTANSSSGSLQPPSDTMSAFVTPSNTQRDQVSDLPPVATSTVLPERSLLARLLTQGRWDETAANFWVARHWGVLSDHWEVPEPLDGFCRQVVAAVITAGTVDEIAAAINGIIGQAKGHS